MSDPTQAGDPAHPLAQRKPKWTLYVAIVALGLLATGLVAWYVLQRETPTVVVQRFWSALKGDRFEQAYGLIDWPEEKRVDEKTFVQTAKAIRAIGTIQKYKLLDARIEGDTAIVPVAVTISISTFTGMRERSGTIDMRCRFVNGKWMVRPDVKQGFLGLGKLLMPGK